METFDSISYRPYVTRGLELTWTKRQSDVILSCTTVFVFAMADKNAITLRERNALNIFNYLRGQGMPAAQLDNGIRRLSSQNGFA